MNERAIGLINREKTGIQVLFPTPVYTSEVVDPAGVNRRLAAAVRALKAECDARGLASPEDYVNSWTSYYFADVVLKRDPRFAEVTAFIQASLENFAHNLGYDLTKKDIVITWLWANIQYRGGTHRKHFHGGSLLSGVYYVTAPANSARLKLYDPKEVARMAEPVPDMRNRLNMAEVDVVPRSGMTVLFPSYLQHEVIIHGAEEERISLAFNAILDEHVVY